MDPAAIAMLEATQFVKPIEEATERGDSEVQRFYQDAVLFITGATGFIGKQLLEKLFRSCEIRKAYLLIRPKQGKSTKERLQDMLNDPVFEPVLVKKPGLASKIVCVEGDAGCIQLGISKDDWNTIVYEVDVIFHMAATVRFDENIRTATYINVRGTRETLALGKACKKLRSFVHMSTTYSHATKYSVGNTVREQFYTSPMAPDALLSLVNNEDTLEANMKSLISDWQNTYTFTKAVAEELVHAESGKLPVCIVRPSIVVNTYREPVPGWLDPSGVYGTSGVIVGVVMGVLRVLMINSTMKFYMVPVDFSNNATIVAGWQTGVRGCQEPLIYNISNIRCGLTFETIFKTMRSKCRNFISPIALWYCYMMGTSNKLIYWVLSWLLHYIPAYTVDAVIKVLRLKKPRQLKSLVHLYTKIDKLSNVISYYLTHEWHFDDTNLQQLWRGMSPTDRTIYNFDMSSIDWEYNTLLWILGIRKYIIKDGLKGTEAAVAKQKWLKLANYAIGVLYLVIIWVVFRWMFWCARLVL